MSLANLPDWALVVLTVGNTFAAGAAAYAGAQKQVARMQQRIEDHAVAITEVKKRADSAHDKIERHVERFHTERGKRVSDLLRTDS